MRPRSVIPTWSINLQIRPAGFEPATYGLEDRCSIQLSYGRLMLSVVFCIILGTECRATGFNHSHEVNRWQHWEAVVDNVRRATICTEACDVEFPLGGRQRVPQDMFIAVEGFPALMCVSAHASQRQSAMLRHKDGWRYAGWLCIQSNK